MKGRVRELSAPTAMSNTLLQSVYFNPRARLCWEGGVHAAVTPTF
jgi:hypothetical protein